MNKQERDELREFILCNYPYEKTSTMPRFTGETVLELLDLLDAYESVVEAVAEYRKKKNDGYRGNWLLVMHKLEKALEGLEYED